MFGYCASLTNLDLSNFDAQNVINMSGMFYGCDSLYKVITKDQKILNEFSNKV